MSAEPQDHDPVADIRGGQHGGYDVCDGADRHNVERSVSGLPGDFDQVLDGRRLDRGIRVRQPTIATLVGESWVPVHESEDAPDLVVAFEHTVFGPIGTLVVERRRIDCFQVDPLRRQKCVDQGELITGMRSVLDGRPCSSVGGSSDSISGPVLSSSLISTSTR